MTDIRTFSIEPAVEIEDPYVVAEDILSITPLKGYIVPPRQFVTIGKFLGRCLDMRPRIVCAEVCFHSGGMLGGTNRYLAVRWQGEPNNPVPAHLYQPILGASMSCRVTAIGQGEAYIDVMHDEQTSIDVVLERMESVFVPIPINTSDLRSVLLSLHNPDGTAEVR